MFGQSLLTHVASGFGLWVLAASVAVCVDNPVAHNPVVLAVLLPMGIVLHMRAAHITAQYGQLHEHAASLELRNEQLRGEKQRLEFERAMLYKRSNDAVAATATATATAPPDASPNSTLLPLFVRSVEQVAPAPGWDDAARLARTASSTSFISMQSSVLLSPKEAAENAPATWAPLLSSDDNFEAPLNAKTNRLGGAYSSWGSVSAPLPRVERCS